MSINFIDFCKLVIDNPSLLITIFLILAAILVNGWTDAPNAIATAISTRAIAPVPAIIMAAVFNFLGILVMTLISSAVSQTIYNMVDFGINYHEALIALCAAMVSIVIWAVVAWYFGIPTSESHALIAGITGAAIAIHNSFSGINGNEWMKVIYGLLLSTALGFVMGYLTTKLIKFIFKNIDRRKTTSTFRSAQVAGSAAMAFMHGAQDGQKFMGVFLLGMALSNGQATTDTFIIPFWLILLCSLVMGLGTSIGGHRIIKAVGMDMIKMETYQGFSADIAAAGCLLISSLTGIPVSTTHTKTTAIMGVGASNRIRSVNWSIAKEMVLTWILTFPGCGLIGFIVAKIFIYLL